MNTSSLGTLLFIDVNPEFRGKEQRYAERLLRYAIDQMKMMGAASVELVTRTDNEPAQRLYKRVGFY